MKRIITATLLLAVMASCSKEQSYSGDGSDVVTFSSAAIETKVSTDGTMWSASESIGITMYDVDTENANDESLNSSNVHYISTNTDEQEMVNFEIATDATALLYPNTGSVKFYAYYPYQATSDGVTYTADVSDQSVDVDFMIASSEVVTRETLNNPLTFTHMLSKLTLKISGRDNVTDMSELKVSLVGLSTTGEYDINTGAQVSGTDLSGADQTINLIVSDDDTEEATATAIILPEVISSGVVVNFSCDDRSFNITIPALSEFEVGLNHTYTVALGNDMPDFLGASILSGWEEDAEDELFSGDVYEEVISFDSSDLLAALILIDTLDTDANDEITYTEAAAYSGTLDITSCDIYSFDQIKYFLNITGLNCFGNYIAELDVTSCPNLGKKDGSYNSSLITVGQNVNLTLYVTQAQWDAGLNQTLIESNIDNNDNVTVTVQQ